jgi:hypothetical protein
MFRRRLWVTAVFAAMLSSINAGAATPSSNDTVRVDAAVLATGAKVADCS